ncbi:hypothetical protein [Nocardiopsis ganjiahuensis]|uniref:hypothetical protein n=1 Tax=Nocardiopsis ganjiahuensis TaxID=239984 RepID=UPI000366D8E1|nr:hypothetical protein [Nocardiopsis ganjiahuensis]
MYAQEGSAGPDGGGGKVDTARAAADEVASSAKEEVRSLAGEARSETEHVVHDVQARLREEAEHQTRRASGNLRQWSQDLASMAEHGETDSPVGGVVRQVAERGRGAADFLEHRGVDGLLEEARDFARRRPVAFLLGSAVAGFALGRVLKASSSVSGQPGPVDGPPEESTPRADHRNASTPGPNTPAAGETILPSVASERLGRAPGSEGG